MIIPLYILLLFLPLTSSSQLSVAWPFNSQLPFVARCDSQYSFSLASSTFNNSSSSPVEYSLKDNPQWLSISSSEGILSGTPDSSSSQIIQFDILANNSQSEHASLQLSINPPPQLVSSDSIISQLSHFGYTNGNNAIIIAPGSQFSFSFAKSQTFQKNPSNGNDIVAYYGLSANRTSLPPWIEFSTSDNNLTFSGTAPTINSNIAPSIEYSFDLIASDYPGYSGVIANFAILVGAHQLSTTSISPVQLEISPDHSDFNISLPLDSILLDNQPIFRENISQILLGDTAPSWVQVNPSNAALYGDIPSNTVVETPSNFTVTVYDTYQDSVSLTVQIVSNSSTTNTTNTTTTSNNNNNNNNNTTTTNTTSSTSISTTSSSSTNIFQSSNVPSVVDATRGKWFQYALPSSMFVDPTSTNITAIFTSDWLIYHSSNWSFTGQAPTGKNFSDINITLNGYHSTVSRSVIIKRDLDQVSFTIHGISHSAMSNHTKLAIILATVIPSCLLLIVLLIVFLTRRNRNDNSQNDIETQSVNSTSSVTKEKHFDQSFTTDDQDLTVAKTISNHSLNDGSECNETSKIEQFNNSLLLGYSQQMEDSSSHADAGNWQIVRDSSSLTNNSSANNNNNNNNNNNHSPITQKSRIDHLSKVASNIINSAERNANHSDAGSVASSTTATDIATAHEFTEKFDDDYYSEKGQNIPDSRDTTGTAGADSISHGASSMESQGDRFVDTVEYQQPEMLSTDNLLDFPSELSSNDLGADNNGSRVPKSNGFNAVNGRVKSFFTDSQKSTENAGSGNSKPHDTAGIPRKSWRHVVDSTRSRFTGSRRQESINSLATVATDELFSVRLVDDTRQSLAMNDAAIGGLNRRDSGNIKKLDSEGNIVNNAASVFNCRDSYSSDTSSNYQESSISSPDQQARMSNLDVLAEEETHSDALNLSAEVGRNANDSGLSGVSGYSTAGNNVAKTMLSYYSEAARAQKASHSRKRNLSQTYSSSSNSHSKGGSKSYSSGSSKHNPEDSFTFDAGNPLPVIYSPDLANHDDSNFGIPKRNPSRTMNSSTAAAARKRHLSEVSSSTGTSNSEFNSSSYSSSDDPGASISATSPPLYPTNQMNPQNNTIRHPNLSINSEDLNLSIPALSPGSENTEDEVMVFGLRNLRNNPGSPEPMLVEFCGEQQVSHHKRSRSSMNGKRDKSGSVEYGNTEDY
ncbi:Axl2 protein [Saccharomycopsis crataegensis]|uniref:Axl2 protein n=1 Tax=Saccharomycopsis crataegensis TaxID=43959 RepID=A0AAV5QL30_9ASCO|nr:Axl2 protein [Saccharomycopsis crataegensis]